MVHKLSYRYTQIVDGSSQAVPNLVMSLCRPASTALLLTLLALPTFAAEPIPEMFLPPEQAGQHTLQVAQDATGRKAMRFNHSLSSLPPGSEVRFSLDRHAGYEVIYDHLMHHPSGNMTWVGHLKGYSDDYRAIVTYGEGGISGRILTPKGEFLLETDTEGQWLVDVQATGRTPAGVEKDDVLIPAVPKHLKKNLYREGLDSAQDQLDNTLNRNSASSSDQANIIVGENPTTIDVMILYTPGLASRLGSGLSSRLDQLVALSNQAYRDSKVYINLRLVHQEQINYSGTISNHDAFYEMVDGVANIGLLRNTYGADIVALIRPFIWSAHKSCGNGGMGIYAGYIYPDQSFSAISDGDDLEGTRRYCRDLTFTHELGHNMGSMHDRANSKHQGAYSYSYGYGIEGTFGTIMSYIDPGVGKFSNPNIMCANGISCGISETASDSANNVLSLNSTRTIVANFRKTAIASRKVENDFNGDGRSDLAGLTSAGRVYYTTNLKDWYLMPGVLSQLTSGDFNGDGRSDLAGLSNVGNIYYTINFNSWALIRGQLNRFVNDSE